MQRKLILLTTALVMTVLLGLAIAAYGAVAALVLAGLVLFGTYVAILLRFPERGLWLLAIGLPYERLGVLPIGLFTLKFGHVVSVFIVLSWFAKTALTKTLRLATDPLRIPLLLFLAACVLSLINAVDLTRGLVLIAQLLVGYLVYVLVINFLKPANLKPTLLALWAGAGLIALFGLYQFVGDYLGLKPGQTGLLPSYSGTVNFGFARIQGASLEPLYFANYLLLPVLTLAAVLVGTRAKRRLWLIPLVLLLLVVFTLTLARGAFFGLAVGVLGLLVVYWREIFRPRVIITLASGALATLFVVIVLLLQTDTGQKDPLGTFSKQIAKTGQDTSGEERLGAQRSALELWPEHPLIGVGVGNFGHYYRDPHSRNYPDRAVLQVVNNQTLETLVETGLLGLLTLTLVAVVLAERTWRAWKRSRQMTFLRAALLGTGLAVLAIFIQAQTFSAIYLMHVWFAIGLLVGIQNVLLAPRPKQRRT